MPLAVRSTSDGHLVARIKGELTISTLEELKDDLFGLFNAKDVSLDLSGVTEFDGCGLQVLAIMCEEATRNQRKLQFEPTHEGIAKSMQLLGFDSLLGNGTGSSHGPD